MVRLPQRRPAAPGVDAADFWIAVIGARTGPQNGSLRGMTSLGAVM
jgi:hypothetical protein